MPFAPHSAPGSGPIARRWGYWTLFVCLVNNGVANSMLFALLPPFARETGVSEWALAATYVVAAAFFTVMSQIWGAWSDRIGRRPVIMIGLAGAAVSMFLMAETIALTRAGVVGAGVAGLMLVGSRAIFGLTNSAVGPAAVAWVADRSTPETRTAAIATLSAAIGLGAAAGPSIGAALAPFMGVAGPFVVTGFIALAGLVAVRALLPELTPPMPAGRRGVFSSLAMVNDPRLRDTLLYSSAVWTVQAVGLQLIGFAVMDRLQLDGAAAASAAGVVLSAGAAASLLAQMVAVPRLRLKPRPAMLAGGGIALGGVIAFAVAPSFATLIAAVVLQFFGVGLARPGAMAAASLAVEPHEQGAAAGLASATAGVGFFTAAFLGTGVYTLTNAAVAFLTAGAALLAALIMAVRSRSIADASARAKPSLS